MKAVGILIGLCMVTVSLCAQTKRVIVAADGSGNYKAVQAAINAVPDSSRYTTVIYIKKGIYKEKLTLPPSKQHVHLIGEDITQTLLTYDDYHTRKDEAGKEIGTSGSASFHIYGSDFTAENITFQNDAGIRAGQAVAVWVAGDKACFKHCCFLGFQDTLYTFGYGSRQYYDDCYIEGTVDFIFGAATAWFQNCRIFCKGGGGYVTAASTPDSTKYGYVFNKCNITGNATAKSFALGRPWRPYAKTVYLHCNLGEQIKPEGWSNWNTDEPNTTSYYAEYENTGAGYQPSRRLPWSHQLTKEEARQYTIVNVLRGWQPDVQ